MSRRQIKQCFSVLVLGMPLAACGGGGGGNGGGLVSTPTPPQSGSAAVEIFNAPAPQEFVALGSDGAGDQLRIRYVASTNQYQVLVPGSDWDRLVDDPSHSPPPGDPNLSFVLGSLVSVPRSHFLLRAHFRSPAPEIQYQYSNLFNWSVGNVGGVSGSGVTGSTAFGIATPAGGVPVTGTATYRGLITGVSTIDDPIETEVAKAQIDGSVLLNFDFGAGTLSGEMRPYVNAWAGRTDLAAVSFINTVFSTGSRTYSGRFNSSVAGPNSFSGLFTGPRAQELIGKWSFSFIYPRDGSIQSASGAWIAKKD